MGTYRVRKGSGNRVIKEGKMGLQGKAGRTSPGKAIFTMREIRA